MVPPTEPDKIDRIERAGAYAVLLFMMTGFGLIYLGAPWWVMLGATSASFSTIATLIVVGGTKP